MAVDFKVIIVGRGMMGAAAPCPDSTLYAAIVISLDRAQLGLAKMGRFVITVNMNQTERVCPAHEAGPAWRALCASSGGAFSASP